MNRILIVEDEEVIRDALVRLLEREGYVTVGAPTLERACEESAQRGFDLIISDLRLPDGEGTDLIACCQNVPVLIMTSYASVRSAVEAMKKGAVDYIAKPFDHDEMLLNVARLLKQRRLEVENARLRSDLSAAYPVHGMVGESPAMRRVFEVVERIAPTDATVLIRGESGTGKELVARAIHERSNRADHALVAVNCASIPEGLIEAELFGHERGAFTGATEQREGLVEAADRGTLFLDEIGELNPAAQSRLLRALQEGEIRRVGSNTNRKLDIRLLAATHRDLEEMVREGGFREDLYYRLKVIEIPLPPLRGRKQDIAPLATFLLERAAHRLSRTTPKFSSAALEAMQRHDWPGNVRELENAIERAVILADEVIAPDDLALGLSPRETPTAETPGLSLDEYFRSYVLANQGRMTETDLARGLGLSRKALWERRQRMGIPRPKA